MKLVIGNWKMNGSLNLVNEFLDFEDAVIGMPFPYLAYAHCQNKGLKLAAQDCSIYENFGSHTGEVSAKMLRDIGCEYVIIGHSERRRSSSFDTIENILKKLKNAVNVELISILCIDDDYENLLNQETLNFLEDNLDKVILAYEPLSAIGTGIVPSNSEIFKSIEKIKNRLDNIKVLYGGSVNAQNARDILSITNLDGVLIGGASLKFTDFKEIAKAALSI